MKAIEMVSDNDWQGVPLTHLKAWQSVFHASREILDLDAPCPVCESKALHRWYHVHQIEERWIGGLRCIGRGGLWEWCSGCQSFEHYSVLVPEWWSCDLEVDEKKLTAFPTAIEEAIRKREQNR